MRCLVIRSDDEELRFPLPETEARLGSDPSNDLVVPIVGVSRFHARLVPDSVAPRLIDLGSKNGLVVDGKRSRDVALLPGVVVRAGGANISMDDAETSDFDVAVEFPRVPGDVRRAPKPGGAETETVSTGSGSLDALSLVRDLERFEKNGRAPQDPVEFLDRLERLLRAESVALLRSSHSAFEVVLAVGEALTEGTFAALSGVEPQAPGLQILELEGRKGAWAPPSERGRLALLVVLPPGSDFAPWQRQLLDFSLEHLTDEKRALARKVAATTPRRPRLVYPEGMVPGTSPAMRGLLGQIARTVHSRIDVLVLGETGTGKELIARTIHASGPTPNGPFVAINCAAIPGELLESELFGVRARVATGVDAQPGRILDANGGTLLLDEIGEMPLSLQAKLLRFLQEREVHSVGASRPEKVSVRVVSTSNRDLLAEVKAGRFRADLYYRLRGLQFHVPPLRDRKEEIADLVTSFALRAAAEDGKSIRGLSRKALDLLRAYDWPGNVRELQSEVNRAVLFCPHRSVLSPEHFGPVRWTVGRVSDPRDAESRRMKADLVEERPVVDVRLDLRERVEELERSLIERALAQAGGNKTRAAGLLGLTRAGLAMKVRRLLGK